MSEKGPRNIEPREAFTDAQAAEIGRFFETYFGGVELRKRTKENDQIIAERYYQFAKIIDSRYYLSAEEKETIKTKMREKIESFREKEETPETSPETVPEITDQKVEQGSDMPELKLETTINAREFLVKFKEMTGCKMSEEDIYKKLIADLKSSRRRNVDKGNDLPESQLLFSEIEVSKTDQIGKAEKLKFRCKLLYRNGTRPEISIHTTLIPTSRTTGDKTTRDVMPKFHWA